MVMIQDSQEVTGQSKPLRITGDPDKVFIHSYVVIISARFQVEMAKRLVTDLLNSREDGSPGGGGGGGMVRSYDSAPTAKGEVWV